MTKGQIAQLQDLSKCYMPSYSFERIWVRYCLADANGFLSKIEKGFLRKYIHLYRHQIAAIKRNQNAE